MGRAAKTVCEKTPHNDPRLILYLNIHGAYSYLNSFARGLDFTTTLLSFAAIEDS